MSSLSSRHDSLQLLSFNREQINMSRNSQYLKNTSERGSSPKSNATKSRTPFDKAEVLDEECLSAGVEYKGGFGIRLKEAGKNELDVEAFELEMLKVELAERKLKQAQREQDMQEMLESKLESSKEEPKSLELVKDDLNLPTTRGTIETEPAVVEASVEHSVWCCGKRPCLLM